MNKQIKTAEGIIELDENLVKLLEANSYIVGFIKTKNCAKDNKSEESHYCINILNIEENELGAEDVLDDSEVLALYLQQNGYGDVKQAVKEFAKKLKNDDRLSVPTQIIIGGIINELIKEIYGE